MRDTDNNRTSRFLISSVAAFILTLMLTAATYLAGGYLGFFDKALILDHLNKSDYYSGVMEYANESSGLIAIPSGIPQKVFDGTFTEEMVYRDVRGYLEAAFDGRAYEIDTAAFKERLTENVTAYVEQEGLELTEEQEVYVEDFASQIADNYVNSAKMPFVSYFVNIRNGYINLIKIAIPALAAGAALLMVFLAKINMPSYRAMLFVGSSTIAAGLMSIIVPAWMLVTGFYRRINVTPEYFFEFVSSYMLEGIRVFIYLGVLWLIASAMILTIAGLRRKNSLEYIA